jgi:hypothetical protein
MSLFQIKDWDVHFENDRSRQRANCSFVCVPNKQHGMGFCRIMAEPDGAAIYGIWHCIVGACSQQKKRNGWLTTDGDKAGSAWGVGDLALKFRRPESEISRALQVLASEKVGWIIEHRNPQSNHEVTTYSPPTHLERIERKKEEKEQNGVPVIQQIEARMNLIYRRKPTDPWKYDEQHALAEVSRRPDAIEEMVHICFWRGKMPPDDRKRFFPQTVLSLLSRWTEHLDKAHVQCPKPNEKTTSPKPPSNLKPFIQSPDLAKKFREEATKPSAPALWLRST